ncbi:hypothetical protein [Syntrophus aciditrophicus]|nr:hypothetical protein [Syntrophus aciditrophicus]
MATKRNLIRWFIQEVQWAVPRNVSFFMEGRCDDTLLRVYSSELSEMLKGKDSSLRLKRIKNQDGKLAYTMAANTLPTFLFNHDVCVRDVVGKFLHDRGLQYVSFRRPADATILHYCFELDNGHMTDSQLEEKLRKHYMGTRGQIVFIMRHREFPHLEAHRLQKVFNISAKVFPEMPNKVLGACYTQFVENGIIYNRKGKAM